MPLCRNLNKNLKRLNPSFKSTLLSADTIIAYPKEVEILLHKTKPQVIILKPGKYLRNSLSKFTFFSSNVHLLIFKEILTLYAQPLYVKKRKDFFIKRFRSILNLDSLLLSPFYIFTCTYTLLAIHLSNQNNYSKYN